MIDEKELHHALAGVPSPLARSSHVEARLKRLVPQPICGRGIQLIFVLAVRVDDRRLGGGIARHAHFDEAHPAVADDGKLRGDSSSAE